MHYNKQCNDLFQSEINAQTTINCTPSITAKETGTEICGSSERILSVEKNTKNGNETKYHEASDMGIYAATSTSCTSSTDSGVNISDNDEIPPSPTSSQLHSFPSSTSSSSETTVNPFNKQLHKNSRNRDNNKNNKKGNNYKNNKQNFNGDNGNYDDDHDHDYEYNHNISTSSDNKLKSEQHRMRLQDQQFLKVENSSNGDNNTRYQTNQNVNESDDALNISHQRNLQTPTTSVTPAATRTDTNNSLPSLQHNEFISPPQRSASTSSSFSMSSIMSTNSDDDINPPSKIQHCSGSPVVSIRSINSSIITSDSDSDSDLSGDTEGVHTNYVIKKLGTQVSYPPKHPDIPNINSGHTVVNQQVVPNCNDVLASSLATLAAIGDRIGAAQALGPVPSFSAVPQRPQIGSIALSNSSDVTFGDKHFYEGPVTIQQFLIDGRDKWKETNGKENPTFVDDTGEPFNNAPGNTGGMYWTMFRPVPSTMYESENEINCLKSSTNIKWLRDYCLVSGPVNTEKNELKDNITEEVIKQLELQENRLVHIRNRVKVLESERSYKNGSIDIKAKDINLSAEQSGKLYGYISKRKKLIIPGVLALMALLIVATIFGIKALSDSKNTNNNDDGCSGNGTLCIIDRDVWRAHPQKNNLDKQKLPLHRVVISHTASEPCETIRNCAERVRVIQEFHMNSLGWDDIGYNFLISSDGRVYVGRGWDVVGAHTKGYNYDSVGITFIGTYINTPPTEAQLNACLSLLDEGLRINKLAPEYNIYGARQLGATESPGAMLYNIIKKWKHWSVDVKRGATTLS